MLAQVGRQVADPQGPVRLGRVAMALPGQARRRMPALPLAMGQIDRFGVVKRVVVHCEEAIGV
jgi:hypothetical protein